MRQRGSKFVLYQLVSLICVLHFVRSTHVQAPSPIKCNKTSDAIRRNLSSFSAATKGGRNVVAAPLPTSVKQASGREFVVVVDCGSSGSRIQIYHWPRGTPDSDLANQLQTLRDPSTQRALTLRIRPGLSSVRDHPERASDYLVPLLQFASEHVPAGQHRTTPVYVLGTAGLRLLTMRERTSILQDVVRDSSKEFGFKLVQAEVISGSEEGFFQWLSVNLLARRLGRRFDQAQGLAFYFQRASARRFGLIEMGGVSAQVAFEVTPAMDQLIGRRLGGAALRAFKELRLGTNLGESRASLEGDDAVGTNEGAPAAPKTGAKNASVFSVSFLGFGSDNARSLAIDLLVRDAMTRFSVRSGGRGSLLPLVLQPNSTMVVEDPCLPRDSEDAVLKPATVLYSPIKTIGYNSARPSDQAVLIRLVGKGNFAQCRALIGRLIALAKREQTTCMQLDSHNICDNSLIGANFIPWQQLQFLALGDLFYTTKLLNSSGRFNGPTLLYQTSLMCARNQKEIDALLSADDEFSRARNRLACFKATWILAWLTSVLRLPLDGSADLTTTDQVMGDEADWKLGAVLAQTVGYSTKWL